MTIKEQITIFEHNAEHERKEGDLNNCLHFRQLAEWLKDYKRCGDAISRLDKIQQTLYALDKEVADKEVTRDYWDGFCKVFNAIEVILDENSD